MLRIRTAQEKEEARRWITYWEQIDALYYDETPDYLKKVGRNRIVIIAAQWEGAEPKAVSITPADVVAYYATQAGNSTSGCRTLAGFTSDWRMVDNMAHEALNIFKILNRKALDREAQKQWPGLELKKEVK